MKNFLFIEKYCVLLVFNFLRKTSNGTVYGTVYTKLKFDFQYFATLIHVANKYIYHYGFRIKD